MCRAEGRSLRTFERGSKRCDASGERRCSVFDAVRGEVAEGLDGDGMSEIWEDDADDGASEVRTSWEDWLGEGSWTLNVVPRRGSESVAPGVGAGLRRGFVAGGQPASENGKSRSTTDQDAISLQAASSTDGPSAKNFGARKATMFVNRDG